MPLHSARLVAAVAFLIVMPTALLLHSGCVLCCPPPCCRIPDTCCVACRPPVAFLIPVVLPTALLSQPRRRHRGAAGGSWPPRLPSFFCCQHAAARDRGGEEQWCAARPCDIPVRSATADASGPCAAIPRLPVCTSGACHLAQHVSSFPYDNNATHSTPPKLRPPAAPGITCCLTILVAPSTQTAQKQWQPCSRLCRRVPACCASPAPCALRGQPVPSQPALPAHSARPLATIPLPLAPPKTAAAAARHAGAGGGAVDRCMGGHHWPA